MLRARGISEVSSLGNWLFDVHIKYAQLENCLSYLRTERSSHTPLKRCVVLMWKHPNRISSLVVTNVAVVETICEQNTLQKASFDAKKAIKMKVRQTEFCLEASADASSGECTATRIFRLPWSRNNLQGKTRKHISSTKSGHQCHNGKWFWQTENRTLTFSSSMSYKWILRVRNLALT